MSWLYRHCLRPVLFSQESEAIHNRTLTTLGWISQREVFCDAIATFFAAPPLPVELFGLAFPNPVGLAAGMDKHAAAAPVWPALGFGFSELGGVTWHPQPGNPAPRMFRAVEDEALLNRMGFNNGGAEAMARQLAHWKSAGRWPTHPVGLNLGKSKITPLTEAAADYARSLQSLWPLADFFVVNVSSPNTPNLRQLQDKAALDEVLAAVQDMNATCSRRARPQIPGTPRSRTPAPPPTKPVLIKIAPDLSFEAMDEILALIEPRGIAGIIATNTTLARPETSDEDLRTLYAEPGGLSGRPLRARSTEVLRHLYRQSAGTVPLIGVGGIFSAADAWEKITAGASLVQLYTGLVYEGPALVKEIVEGLQTRLAERGWTELRQAVGSAAQ